MTFNDCINKATPLSKQETVQVKGGTITNSEFIIFEDTDVV